MPRRRTSYRRISAGTGKRETQRRAALAILAFIGVVAVLGVGLWYWQPLRGENPIEEVTAGEAALAAATQKAALVFGPDDLLISDPPAARRLLQGAWDDLRRARTASVDPAAIDQLSGRIRPALEKLYVTLELNADQFYAAPAGVQITALARGPDDAAYAIAGQAVLRIDPQSGAVATIIQAGDGAGQGIGAPRLLARGGPDLLIVDVRGSVWRWRPSGTLDQLRVAGEQVWGETVVDIQSFVINPDSGLYRLYVPYPATSQLLRYDLTADGGGFSAPAPYFVAEDEDVTAFRQLYIDGDVYAVTSANLVRYFNGRQTGFSLDPPPDAEDLRVGHDYALMAATGTRGVGRLFVWDRQWSRLLVYDKTEGSYTYQFEAAQGSPPMTDLVGLYLVDRGEVQPPIVVWARADGLYQAVLSQTGQPDPSPSATPAATATPPSASPTPSGPTAPPTERPRRTPRVAEPSPTP